MQLTATKSKLSSACQLMQQTNKGNNQTDNAAAELAIKYNNRPMQMRWKGIHYTGFYAPTQLYVALHCIADCIAFQIAEHTYIYRLPSFI